MTTRTTALMTRVLVILGSFLVGVASVATLLHVASSRSAPAGRASAAIGGPFRLVDQEGREMTEQAMKGRPFLVFFGFTHCPDACPTTLFELSEVLTKLGPDANRVGALFITVDPERDTSAALKDYLSNFDPHLIGLTGNPDAIASVAKEYRVYMKKVPTEGGDYTMDHTAIVYLMDRDGHFIAPFSLKRPPEDAAADLRRYL